MQKKGYINGIIFIVIDSEGLFTDLFNEIDEPVTSTDISFISMQIFYTSMEVIGLSDKYDRSR